MKTVKDIMMEISQPFERPRIDALLQQGFQFSLTTIVAGPGYGKTTAVASFLQQQEVPCLWLGLSEQDNEILPFWKKLTEAFCQAFPFSAAEFSSFEFPDTEEAFVQYRKKLGNAVRKIKQMYVVIDNYERLTNQSILQFINRCIYSDGSNGNICHILISNEKLDFSHNPFHQALDNNRGYNKITARDLALDLEEMKQLFRFYGRSESAEELTALRRRTGGWPDYVFQIARGANGENSLSERFEKRYFSGYDSSQQAVLIRLALLPRFSSEIIKQLDIGSYSRIARFVEQHIFIDKIRPTQAYEIQPLYKQYLKDKAEMLEEAEKTRVWEIAGGWFLENGFPGEACRLFVMAKNHLRVIDCLKLLSNGRFTVADLDRVQKLLQQFPEEISRTNPWVDFYMAYSYLFYGQTQQAKKGLTVLLQQLEKKPGAENDQLAAETHRILAEISLIQNDLQGFEHMKKVAAYLSDGGSIISRNTVVVGENPIFFLPKDDSVSVDDMVRFVSESQDCWESVTDGRMVGYDLLFRAEAAFAVCDFEQAEHYAVEAIRKAQPSGRHGVVIQSYFVLTHVVALQGDYAKGKQYSDQMKFYLRNCDIVEYIGLQDIMNAIYSLLLKQEHKVAPWIRNADLRAYETKPLWNGFGIIACALYTLHYEQYAKTLSILSRLEEVFAQQGVWNVRLLYHAIKAIAHFHLHEESIALDEFEALYRMVVHHNIFCLFIELGSLLLPVVQLANRKNSGRFEESWLEELTRRLNGLIATFERLKLDYRQAHGMTEPPVILTEREKAVVSYLSRGMTRDEIAKEIGLTVNGVKKCLTSIYRKLGAKNRADAVYIATQKGIIT